MKITDFAIIFVILLSPLFITTQWKDEDSRNAKQLSKQYDTALTAAVQDATYTIRLNTIQEYENSYESLKYMRVNKEEALDTFFKTLFINFGVEEPISQNVLKRYIPAIAIVDYDALWLNVYQPFQTNNGENVIERTWLSKYPFSYSDQEGNVISFTLDDYVKVYDVSTNKWYEGFREELRSVVTIPLLDDADLFENVRRSTIVNTIQEQLAYYINEHNTYTKRFGITYKFTLPLIPKEDWNNTIDDVSLIAFIQGYPIGRGFQYNNYALGGSRLTKNTNIYGTTINGIRYYYREDCDFTYPVEEIFSSPKEAAKNGYRILKCNH